MSALPPCRDLPAEPLVGLRILLVEDDAEVREATESLLLAEGAQVLALAAAAAAFLVLGGDEPLDLLISDVVLGGPLSGIDVAAAARRLRPALAVVLATGYAAPAEAPGRTLPVDIPLLLKPYRRSALLAAAAEALAAQRRPLPA